MEYLTVRETAEKWNVSPRMVQQLCTAGRIPGAQKFGTSWAIPAAAEKPRDPRSAARREEPAAPAAGLPDHASLMPLMNTPFRPGQCRAAVEAMEAGPRRDIARAEYYYFTGQPEQAARAAGAYLTSPDTGARLSACLLYAYANLSLRQIQHARFALDEMQEYFAAGAERAPQLRAAGAFVAAASAVLLHLPLPGELPEVDHFLPLLPTGLRAFALYVQAHALYLKGAYAHSAGTVEATLSMGASGYPIPAIYLHLVAVMDYMSLKQTARAEAHLLAAWEIARPDDLIEGFGEHHGLLGAMLEGGHQARVAGGFQADHRHHPTASLRDGEEFTTPSPATTWRTTLTTTEFAIAMLAARDWTTQGDRPAPENIGEYGQNPHFRGHAQAECANPEGPQTVYAFIGAGPSGGPPFRGPERGDGFFRFPPV